MGLFDGLLGSDKVTPDGQPVEGAGLQTGLASLLQVGLGKLFGK